jgi:hypothetical protein
LGFEQRAKKQLRRPPAMARAVGLGFARRAALAGVNVSSAIASGGLTDV